MIPLPQDTLFVDANAFNGATTFTIASAPRIGAINFTGVTNTPTIALASASGMDICGDLILVSGMTHGTTNGITLAGRGSRSFDGGGLTWPASNLAVNTAPSSTYSLASAFTSSGALFASSGTLALNGHNLTTTAITVQGGTISGTGAITGTTFTQTAGTTTLGGTMTLTGADAISGGTFNTNGNGVTGHNTLAISGGTVNLDAQFNGSAGITLSGGTTNDSGAAGELKGTTFSCTAGIQTLRKLTLSSTFAASSTCAYTFPSGANGTYATSWNESNTSGSSTIIGKLVRSSGSYTVTPIGSFTFGN